MNRTEEKYIIEVYFEDAGETFYVGHADFVNHENVLVSDPLKAWKYTYNRAKEKLISYDWSTKWYDEKGVIILTGDILNRSGYSTKIKKMTIQYTW